MLYRVHELAGLWPLRLAPFFPISVSCPYLLWRGGPYQVCAMLRPRFPPEQSLDPVQLSPVSAPTCPIREMKTLHSPPSSLQIFSPLLNGSFVVVVNALKSILSPRLSAGSCTVWMLGLLEVLSFKLQPAYEKFK